jgi:hypothetical protein
LRKNLKVTPVLREAPDSETIALAIWIQTKRLGRAKRREHEAKARRQQQLTELWARGREERQ